MRTINEWLRLNHRRYPTREALVDERCRLTFAETAERAWQLARGLREAGVHSKDNVGVLAGNSVFNAECLFGIASAGGTYVAFNWRWSAQELAVGIKTAEAKIILVEERMLESVEHALEILGSTEETLPTLVVEGAAIEKLRTGTGVMEDIATPDSPLCIIYTGGSTGTPKGVVISHRAAAANAFNEMYDCGFGRRPDERGLILTPLFHSAALLCWLVPHFIAGATSVLADRFTDETVLDWVARERITNTFLIPNMMRKLMQNGVFADPSVRRYLKAVHTGAGLLRMPDKEMFAELLPETELYFRYGLTEAGPMVTRLLSRDILDPGVDGSIGAEYLLTEVQLQDANGHEVGVGELGEICVRGPSLMDGYYRNPEATSKAFRGNWLHTGDLATVDDRGFYYFRDRLKEMIKTGGENVYSVEVEQVLHMHPAVLEAAVVGAPDPVWDEEVRAVVVLRNDMSCRESDLTAFLREYLAGYKIPKKVVFIEADQLPRSAAGKLVKSQLKANLGWSA